MGRGRAEHVAFRRQARAFVDDKGGDGGQGDERQAVLQALQEDRAAIEALYNTVPSDGARSESSRACGSRCGLVSAVPSPRTGGAWWRRRGRGLKEGEERTWAGRGSMPGYG